MRSWQSYRSKPIENTFFYREHILEVQRLFRVRSWQCGGTYRSKPIENTFFYREHILGTYRSKPRPRRPRIKHKQLY